MAKLKSDRGRKHRLEVYFRIGQRMRMGPLLLAVVGLLLLAYTYATQIISLWPSLINLLPPSIVDILWLGPARRPLVFALLLLSGLLYLANIVVSRVSVVQARRDHILIRAGLVPLVISYSRVNSLRPVQVGQQYSPKSLKGRDRSLVEPFFGSTAVAVDLRSFPMSEATLRRFWSKFMFLTDRKGVLLVVEDAMVLIQEIDALRSKYLDRKAGRDSATQDVFERAVSQRRRN